MRTRLVVLVALLLASPLATARAENEQAAKALHVLNRLSYGPAAGDIERVGRIGTERYIEEQLNPSQLALPPDLTKRLAALDTLQLDPLSLHQQYGPPPVPKGEKVDANARKAARERARVILREASAARLWRAIESPRQLEEVMVEFWFNHFNVHSGKGLNYLWVGAYEEQAIRPHALGRFRDLLGATARHPAMLFYLDNWQNSAPRSVNTGGKRKGLNENYARELLELHTLGVDGGYTQQDVVAAARVFTGWTLVEPKQRDAKGRFYFDAKRHDTGDKVFLGRPIRSNGMTEGEQVLDMLARHPSTALHVGYKLAQYFVADNPPPALVERLRQRYLDTDGDVRSILQTLFRSPEFWDPQFRNAKFKTPYRYLVSTLRASGVMPDNTRPLTGWLSQQGMALFGCPTPNGYKYTQDAWLNPDALTRRVQLASNVANARLKLNESMVKVDWNTLRETFADQFSASTRAAIDAAPAPLRASMILASPELMRY